MLKIHFANKTFTYLNEYMTLYQTIYNNYIFLKQTFVSVKVSEFFFIMGVTIFLYLSQLQKLTVACYSFFMKNFDYRCNNIFVLVTITKSNYRLLLFIYFIFLFLGGEVPFLRVFPLPGGYQIYFLLYFCFVILSDELFLSGQEIINPAFVRHYIRHLSAI